LLALCTNCTDCTRKGKRIDKEKELGTSRTTTRRSPRTARSVQAQDPPTAPSKARKHERITRKSPHRKPGRLFAIENTAEKRSSGAQISDLKFEIWDSKSRL
jgi:hypothetical protein